jgi:N-acetylmuramoyl-L-alanine amidase
VKVEYHPSPNYNARPPGMGPQLVVIHGTAGATDAADLAWLCGHRSRVSYHYLVGRDGAVYQLVPESKRAWHAGVSRWFGRDNVNDFSIGVALSNAGPPAPYPQVQLDAAAELVADILRRRGLDGSRIVGHVDVAVPHGRKTDPWGTFPWGPFRLAVINHMHPPPPEIVIVPE